MIELRIVPAAPVDPANTQVLARLGDQQLAVRLLDVISSAGVIPLGADGGIDLGQLASFFAGAIATIKMEGHHRMLPVDFASVGVHDALEVCM